LVPSWTRETIPTASTTAAIEALHTAAPPMLHLTGVGEQRGRYFEAPSALAVLRLTTNTSTPAPEPQYGASDSYSAARFISASAEHFHILVLSVPVGPCDRRDLDDGFAPAHAGIPAVKFLDSVVGVGTSREALDRSRSTPQFFKTYQNQFRLTHVTASCADRQPHLPSRLWRRPDSPTHVLTGLPRQQSQPWTTPRLLQPCFKTTTSEARSRESGQPHYESRFES
jgi:hypothetical protein